MSLGRSLAWTSVAAIMGAGCFLDPTCQDHCDGTAIASCEWNCNQVGRSLDLTECYREYGGTDCALQIGPSGHPLGCRMQKSSGGTESPFCIDVSLPVCEEVPGNVFCTGPQSEAICRMTTEGGYAYPVDGGICPDGTECHAAMNGITCVDSPKVACDPAAYPACLDADTIVFCEGREAEGYFRYTGSCGEAWACTGAPGSARCR